MDIINNIWPNWHTVELIGEGSYGKVYKVVREDMGHCTYGAVKVISIPHDSSEIKELTNSGMDEKSITTYYEDMVKYLMDEIKIMESLKTASNIVGIEDFQLIKKDDGIGWNVFIRMELLTSLNEYLLEHTIDVNEVIKLGINICEALKACENVKIIHRDIKVDNIFVNSFGKFKLGDFGIARQLEKTQSALSKKGTSMYMAPEVYKGENYDHTVDIYSLGIVMYRFLNAGRYPFMPEEMTFGDREDSLMRRIRGEKFPQPVNADERLTEILNRACAFEPRDRYQTASEFLSDLTEYKVSESANKKAESVVTEYTEQLEMDITGDFDDEKTTAAFVNIYQKSDKQAEEQQDISPPKEKQQEIFGLKEEFQENGNQRETNQDRYKQIEKSQENTLNNKKDINVNSQYSGNESIYTNIF